ncbi:hypothetical protein [Nonomuraea sp. NPDC050691]|uniref:hypothetical protein n=1 Tax=Nonomuraea sp. NPDC050691 TaxID=3155661 RepID=UPI0033F2E11A
MPPAPAHVLPDEVGRVHGGLQLIAGARALCDAPAAEGLRPVSGGTDTHLALVALRHLRHLRGLGVSAPRRRRGGDHAEPRRGSR